MTFHKIRSESGTLSPALVGARQCGKCPGPFPLAAYAGPSTLRKPSGGAAHRSTAYLGGGR
jgi:hypothetical protein